MDEYWLVWGALTALTFYLLQKFLFPKAPYWEKYGIKTVPLENFVVQMIKGISLLESNIEIYDKAGDSKFVGFQQAGANVVFFKDLDLIKHVLIKDFDHFVDRRTMDIPDKNINNNLGSTSGQKWKDLRSTMTPTFTSGKIRRMFPILKRSADRFVKYVANQVESTNGGQINIEEALGRYTIDSSSTVGLGIDCEIFKEGKSFLASEIRKLSFDFSLYIMLQIFIFSLVPKWIKKYQKPLLDKKANDYFTKMIIDLIKRREETGERHGDFVDLILDAKRGQLAQDEEDAKMNILEKDAQFNDKNRRKIDFTEDVIVANCMMFLFVGLDTGNAVNIFGAYALATNPHIQEKLRNVLQKAVDENGGELNYDICNQLDYLDQCFNETLRMYPPLNTTERMCTKDYRIPGTDAFMPKGSVARVPMHMLHYDEKYFPNPEVFDPDRFSSEVKATRSPYAFAPFGHGPRNCIANRFAAVQSKMIMASLVLNFDIEPSEKTPIPMKFTNSAFLKPCQPLNLKLTPRS